MPFVGWVIKWTRLGRYPLTVQQLDWGSFEVMPTGRNLFVCAILNWACLRVMESVIFDYVNTSAFVKQVILIAVWNSLS